MDEKRQLLIEECSFTTSRSSGSGGQHVNKVETKVTLLFDITGSRVLTHAEKQRITHQLKNRINKEGILLLSGDQQRSQSMNRKAVINTFSALIEKALKPKRKRRATRPTAASIRKRLEKKKQIGEKKRRRQRPDF